MFTEQFFELLLGFGDDWKVEGVETNGEFGKIEIEIEYVGDVTLMGKGTRLYDHAPARRWRHLDTMQYETYIRCRLPRIETKDGKVSTVRPPWAKKHDRHTHLFESAVISLLRATKNQTETARIMRCKFDLVNRIMHAAVTRGIKRREMSESVCEHLSIDEKSFKKGHKYVSVLSDPLTGSVIEVTEDRTKKAAKELIDKGLSKDQQKRVKTISMDMWRPYIAAAGEGLPNVEIVHDKFHLIKYLNAAIDKVRRRETKEHEELKNSRYALLKNKENLTNRQRIKFEEISGKNFEVSRAWQVRENFRDLFDNASPKEGKAIFRNWHEAAIAAEIREIKDVAQMFANHLKGVVLAMTTGFNNAMAERLNGKIQLLKSIARGYRTFANFRSAILFFYGNLSLFPLNSR